MTAVQEQYWELRKEVKLRINNIRNLKGKGDYIFLYELDHELSMLEFQLDKSHEAIDRDIQKMSMGG